MANRAWGTPDTRYDDAAAFFTAKAMVKDDEIGRSRAIGGFMDILKTVQGEERKRHLARSIPFLLDNFKNWTDSQKKLLKPFVDEVNNMDLPATG